MMDELGNLAGIIFGAMRAPEIFLSAVAIVSIARTQKAFWGMFCVGAVLINLIYLPFHAEDANAQVVNRILALLILSATGALVRREVARVL